MRKISFLRGVKIVPPRGVDFYPPVERFGVRRFGHELGQSFSEKTSLLMYPVVGLYSVRFHISVHHGIDSQPGHGLDTQLLGDILAV